MKTQSKTYYAIGMMSGTSLDGIDLAYCKFSLKNNTWNYAITEAETIPYNIRWQKFLQQIPGFNARELAEANTAYGKLLGEICRDFIRKYNLKPDFIASHGHTVFHQADAGLTFQLGSGASIAAETGVPVVCDFRTTDVALGGQGAPLVPVGDLFLFPAYRFCLNLGGFSNISLDDQGNRIAFDICPVNIILNKLSNELGFDFDRDGVLASKGKIDQGLLKSLDGLEYYQKQHPKSLGREWLEKVFIPLINNSTLDPQDALRTTVEHMTRQISTVLNQYGTKSDKVLLTGGGAKNKFLISKLKECSVPQIEIPDDILIDYKEALVFAFLGVLRTRAEINVFRTVTGASQDSCSGCIYLPVSF